MIDDIRFSLRVLLRQRGLSLVAMLTLTLGIGASAAVFSVLNGVVLKPLPYPDSDRLVNVFRQDPPVARGPVSKPDFANIREDVHGLMTVAGHESQAYTLGADDGSRHVLGTRVTGSFFNVFGLGPLRGRWLDAADHSGKTNGVVISNRLWQQQFGGHDEAIGADLMLNGDPWTVVGVAPPAMDFPANTDLWMPMRLAAGEVYRHSASIEWPPGSALVINEALAELLWPGSPADAIGKQIETGFMPVAFTVGGIVGDARQWGLDEKPSPEVYFPYNSAPGPGTTTVILRTSINPLTLDEPLRRAVAEVDSQVPVYNVRTMEQATADSNARRTFALTLLGVFALAAALVAAIGLYGVMAYAVVRRTREVGVRMALGAERRRVLRGFLRDGMSMALAGIGIGMVIAFFFARLLQDLVWGVEITAPMIYLVTGGLLAIVAFGASLVPAWRASRISPMQALRYE